jgi:replication-associated recombination protein RarA
MDPNKKKEIVDDLITFNKSKEYYAGIVKHWKRGYLLYGPQGIGRSSLMQNIIQTPSSTQLLAAQATTDEDLVSAYQSVGLQ